MSIVSSVMISASSQVDGRIAYTELHTDHLGGEYRFPYRVGAGVDAQAVIAARAIALVGKLEDNERSKIANQIEAGVDPTTITPDHLTNVQALRTVLKTAMRLSAAGAMPTALFIDTLSNTQLDAAVTVQQRQRIRARVASLLALKTDLETDQALEEDL